MYLKFRFPTSFISSSWKLVHIEVNLVHFMYHEKASDVQQNMEHALLVVMQKFSALTNWYHCRLLSVKGFKVQQLNTGLNNIFLPSFMVTKLILISNRLMIVFHTGELRDKMINRVQL